MKPPRKLAVHKETLAELTSTEMEAVVAARDASGLACEITDTLCLPTCGPMCTGTSTQNSSFC